LKPGKANLTRKIANGYWGLHQLDRELMRGGRVGIPKDCTGGAVRNAPELEGSCNETAEKKKKPGKKKGRVIALGCFTSRASYGTED